MMTQSVVSGAALSFGHELFTSSASSLVHGAIGEKIPSGGHSDGLPGAGKTVIESLRNAQTSTFRGIANTYDAARKEYGETGEIILPSEVPLYENNSSKKALEDELQLGTDGVNFNTL